MDERAAGAGPRHRQTAAEQLVARFTSSADLNAADAALPESALRGGPELKTASPVVGRAAAVAVADDLAQCVQPRLFGARPFPSRAIAPHVELAPRGMRLRASLLAFIVVVEERAFGAGDLAAVVAVGLESVFAGERADPRRLELDGIERIETCNL